MHPPKVDTRWSLLSLRALVLENAKLRITLLPELGGRIRSIIYKPRHRELLWQNPRIPPRKLPFGASYDDVWCGGWEEMFPNDAPGVIAGESYPDHGETWAVEWDFSVEPDTVALHCQTPVSGMRMAKRVALSGDEAALSVHYRLENPTNVDFSFLWKLHAAMAIRPGCRIEFPPGATAEMEPAFPGTLTSPAEALALRETPSPESRQLHFVYATGFREAWCRVTDPHDAVACVLQFDSEVFRSCWLFASYGGWRNYYVAVIEPATGWPFQIEKVIERGLARSLPAGASLETVVTFRVEETAGG